MSQVTNSRSQYKRVLVQGGDPKCRLCDNMGYLCQRCGHRDGDCICLNIEPDLIRCPACLPSLRARRSPEERGEG